MGRQDYKTGPVDSREKARFIIGPVLRSRVLPKRPPSAKPLRLTPSPQASLHRRLDPGEFVHGLGLMTAPESDHRFAEFRVQVGEEEEVPAVGTFVEIAQRPTRLETDIAIRPGHVEDRRPPTFGVQRQQPNRPTAEVVLSHREGCGGIDTVRRGFKQILDRAQHVGIVSELGRFGGQHVGGDDTSAAVIKSFNLAETPPVNGPVPRQNQDGEASGMHAVGYPPRMTRMRAQSVRGFIQCSFPSRS
jgi:hypothetical protein